MNPFNLLFGGLGVVTLIVGGGRRQEDESAADRLEEDAHCLHCKDCPCRHHGDMLRQRARPEYLALCERFRCAPPAVKFKAMMDNWTLDQIKAELDKAEATQS
jgi:hypothetical protein